MTVMTRKGRAPLRTVAVLVWLAPLLAPADAPSRPPAEIYAAMAAEQAACGPNSLFLFLGLHGIDIDYDDVERLAPRTRNGISLDVVRAACEELGCPADVRKVDWPGVDVRDLTFPIIAHEAMPRGAYGGHYLVLLACEGGRVRYIDGTTGIIDDQPWSWLSRRLTGYCLIRRETPSGAVYAALAVSAVTACLAAVVLSRRRGASSLPLLAVLAGCGGAHAGGTDAAPVPAHAAGVERAPGRDAVNSLYLLLAAHRPDVPYAQVSGRLAGREGVSLHELARIADSFDVPVTTRKVTPSLLPDVPTPFLAAMEAPSSHAYNFSLVHYVGPEHVDLIEGNFATFQRISREEFARYWSGYVLYRPRGGRWPLAAAATVGLTLGSVAGFSVRRFRSGRRNRAAAGQPLPDLFTSV